MPNIFVVALFALIPFGASLLGGFFGTNWNLSAQTSSRLKHLIAGVVIGAVSLEIMPEIAHRDGIFSISIAFILGAAAMMILHHLTKKMGKSLSYRTGAFIDLFVDGLLIGIAFLGGTQTGLLIAISISLCAFFMSLSVADNLKEGSRKSVLIALGATLPIGAFVGSLILHLLPNSIMMESLAFGGAAILYLGLEALLTKGQKKIDQALRPILFFIGFLVMMLLRTLG